MNGRLSDEFSDTTQFMAFLLVSRHYFSVSKACRERSCRSLVPSPRDSKNKRDLSSSYFENILKEIKLKLQMPEEEITLCFPSATEKDIWSQKIVETIVKSTSVRRQPSSDWSNDSETDDKSEQGPPDLPSERTGSYKFKLGRLKGCSYSGEWYNGKMHGKGRDPQTNRRLTDGAGYVRGWNSQ